MTYAIKVESGVQKKLKKLAKRDPARHEVLRRKVKKILADPYRFKPLSGDLHGARRVHIGGSFVLVYDVDEERRIVRLLDYDHHDRVYG